MASHSRLGGGPPDATFQRRIRSGGQTSRPFAGPLTDPSHQTCHYSPARPRSPSPADRSPLANIRRRQPVKVCGPGAACWARGGRGRRLSRAQWPLARRGLLLVLPCGPAEAHGGNMRLLWLWVVCVVCGVTSPEHSPIYVDNDNGQTVAGDDISELDRAEIQEDLLRLLGLHRRPRPAFQEMDSSAPQFLMDIYNSMVDDEDTGKMPRAGGPEGQWKLNSAGQVVKRWWVKSLLGRIAFGSGSSFSLRHSA